MRLCLSLCLALWLGSTSMASAVLINNGLAPPTPANVIDDDTFQAEAVTVRNLGCPAIGPCASPTSTTVAIEPGAETGAVDVWDTSVIEYTGGTLNDDLTAYDSSTVQVSAGGTIFDVDIRGSAFVHISGGGIQNLDLRHQSDGLIDGGSIVNGTVRDDATLMILGGSVGDGLTVVGNGDVTLDGGDLSDFTGTHESATLTVLSGTIGQDGVGAFDDSTMSFHGGELDDPFGIAAFDDALIQIFGGGFLLDGLPVGFGPLPQASGLLTGTLANGDPISIDFYHAGAAVPVGDWGTGFANGTIVLVPEPTTALLLGVGVVGFATCGRRRREPLQRAGSGA